MRIKPSGSKAFQLTNTCKLSWCGLFQFSLSTEKHYATQLSLEKLSSKVASLEGKLSRSEGLLTNRIDSLKTTKMDKSAAGLRAFYFSISLEIITRISPKKKNNEEKPAKESLASIQSFIPPSKHGMKFGATEVYLLYSPFYSQSIIFCEHITQHISFRNL